MLRQQRMRKNTKRRKSRVTTLAARYYCNDYLLPTSPLHYKGCTLLFWYVFLYLFCPAASMYSSHLSPGIIINLHIKSVNTLFHRCYKVMSTWLCNKMLYSKSRNPGMQHVDCVETFHGIPIVVEYFFHLKKNKQKKFLCGSLPSKVCKYIFFILVNSFISGDKNIINCTLVKW